jgi:hypothetical protein
MRRSGVSDFATVCSDMLIPLQGDARLTAVVPRLPGSGNIAQRKPVRYRCIAINFITFVTSHAI